MTVQLAWQTKTQPYIFGMDTQQTITIGRQPNCDIVLKDRSVSRQHVQVFTKQGQTHLRNLSQANPVYLYTQQRMAHQKTTRLKIGDSFDVGLTRIWVRTIHTEGDKPMLELATRYHAYQIPHHEVTILGRDLHCHIVFEDETVSRQHAEITYKDTTFYLRNLSQSNPITKYIIQHLQRDEIVPLQAGQAFRVGSTKIQAQAFVTNHKTQLSKSEQQTLPSQAQADISPAFHHIRCTTCTRSIKATIKDCPWCGTSLANGTTIYPA